MTDAIANYMMIACGMFMQAGKNLLEMPVDLQNEICGRAIQYAMPTSLNTDQVLDSEFVFEVNVVLQHILQNRVIRDKFSLKKIQLVRSTHAVGLHDVECESNRTDSFCVHEPHEDLIEAVELPDQIGVADLIKFCDRIQQISKEEEERHLINMELQGQQFNVAEKTSHFQQIFRDYIQLIVDDDMKYILDQDLAIEEPNMHDDSDYSLIPPDLKQFMHYSLHADHVYKSAHNFSKGMQKIMGLEQVPYNGNLIKLISLRGVVYQDILGDMLFFLKLDSAARLQMKAGDLQVVGFVHPPCCQAYSGVDGENIRIDKDKEDVAQHIMVTDFRLKNATYDME